MAQIIPVGGSVAVTVADYLVAAALFNESNNGIQNNIITIGGTQYLFNTLAWGTSSSGTFSGVNWDVVLDVNSSSPNRRFINSIASGATFQDVVFTNYTVYLDGRLDRNGYTSAVTTTITDSNGLFQSFTSSGTIAATSSNALAKLLTKLTILPGTYRVMVSATDGTTTKSRTFDIVVTAYPEIAAGNGWL